MELGGLSLQSIRGKLLALVAGISLMVGVAYGSPTRKVEEVIDEVVREHDKTVSPPEPVVLFEDFGDSALVFRALFWVVMNRPMDSKRVLSDLRYRLDERFRLHSEDGPALAYAENYGQKWLVVVYENVLSDSSRSLHALRVDPDDTSNWLPTTIDGGIVWTTPANELHPQITTDFLTLDDDDAEATTEGAELVLTPGGKGMPGAIAKATERSFSARIYDLEKTDVDVVQLALAWIPVD